jgi:PAB1-binding protein PBP1
MLRRAHTLPDRTAQTRSAPASSTEKQAGSGNNEEEHTKGVQVAARVQCEGEERARDFIATTADDKDATKRKERRVRSVVDRRIGAVEGTRLAAPRCTYSIPQSDEKGNTRAAMRGRKHANTAVCVH